MITETITGGGWTRNGPGFQEAWTAVKEYLVENYDQDHKREDDYRGYFKSETTGVRVVLNYPAIEVTWP